MKNSCVYKIPINQKFIYAFPDVGCLVDYIADQRAILIAINAEKIVCADSDLKRIINDNIGYPDGVGAVLALRRRGVGAARIPGVELWLEIIKKYSSEKTFYLIGSTDQVVQQAVERLKTRFPDIRILGYRNGYLRRDDDVKSLCDEFRRGRPDFVFVAMGSPKQELLMESLVKAHPAVYVGLGGSFDVFCGMKKRAPVFFQKIGLEWLYRLLAEPARQGRWINYLKFLRLLISNKF